MKFPRPNGLGYYAGSHWLQGAVVLIIVAIIAIRLLLALDDALELAERQSVESTIRNMKTGLRMAVFKAVIEHRGQEVASWEGRNPLVWLQTVPSGYVGDCDPRKPAALPSASWCFARSSRELIYRPRKPQHLVANVAENGPACPALTWRVTKAPEEQQTGATVLLNLKEISDCQWVIE